MSAKVINQSLDKKQIPVLPLLLVTLLLVGSLIFMWTRVASEEDRLNENWSQFASGEYSGGSGSYDSPYQISRAEDLALLAKQVNEGEDTTGLYYELTSDIDLDGREWLPIGTDTSFKGILDGNGYKIIKMDIVLKKKVANYGLFGVLEGKVVDLRIGNSLIELSFDQAIRGWTKKGDLCVGLVAGINKGSITNVTARGNVNITGGKETNFGFVCGKNVGGQIREVLAEGEIVLTQNKAAALGGILGRACDNSNISRSSFIGKINYTNMKNDNYFIGGVVGSADGENVSFTECVSKCSIRAGVDKEITKEIGSFVGNSRKGTEYEKCLAMTRLVSDFQDDYCEFAANGDCIAVNSGHFYNKNTLLLLDKGEELSLKNDSTRSEIYRKTLGFPLMTKKWTISVEDVLPRLQVCLDSYDSRLEKEEKVLVEDSAGKKKLFRYGVYDSDFVGKETVDGKEYVFKRGMVTNLGDE